MTEADFAFLRQLLLLRSGLALSPDKRYLAESRLGILCRRRGIEGLAQLIQALRFGADPTLCLLYTSPSPRDRTRSRMPSSA